MKKIILYLVVVLMSLPMLAFDWPWEKEEESNTTVVQTAEPKKEERIQLSPTINPKKTKFTTRSFCPAARWKS